MSQCDPTEDNPRLKDDLLTSVEGLSNESSTQRIGVRPSVQLVPERRLAGLHAEFEDLPHARLQVPLCHSAPDVQVQNLLQTFYYLFLDERPQIRQ